LTTDDGVFVHAAPVWRERANFIIRAQLPETNAPRRYEPLWARKISDDTFELCCIPFLLYGISLGDIVATDDGFVVQRVLQSTKRSTFRVWLAESTHDRNSLISDLEELGALWEWYSDNLLAVDAADETIARNVAALLSEHESRGNFVFESGR
jgi:hypothetical protein